MRSIALLLLAATACAPTDPMAGDQAMPGTTSGQPAGTLPAPEAPPTAAPAAACDAARVQDVVGKTRSPALAEDARKRSGATVVRYLTPDMIVTMEYRDDRLNLHVGTDGRIGSARCG